MVMKMGLKLHCQVVAIYVPTYTFEVEEKEELKNLLKWGKFSFHVMVHRKNFTYLKNKKQPILIVSKKFKIFDF